MSELPETTGGIFASLRRMLDGGLALAQKRLEILAVELREEKCRLVEALIWAAAVITLGLMTLTLLTFLVVVICWDNGRVTALVVLSVLYLLGTFAAWFGLRSRLKRAVPFAGTLDEIKKDRACLQTGS